MNINDYFSIYEIRTDFSSIEGGRKSFSIQPGYYKLINSWKEIHLDDSQENEPCYINSTCISGLNCYQNPATKQQFCLSDTTVEAKNKKGEGWIPSPYENPYLLNYGTEMLYTAICAQKKIPGEASVSYYPDYKDKELVDQNNENFDTSCQNYLFQESPQGSAFCYDSDQLVGTKTVEYCQAVEGSNNICINNNGDKVYYPDFNSLFIKPYSVLCEDNTSINYISFNFNNAPQTQEVLYKDNGLDFSSNQNFCLSVDTVTYYPDISINSYEEKTVKKYYFSFTGSWDYVYTFRIDGDIPTSFSNDDDVKNINWFDITNLKDFNNEINSGITQRIKIDFATGIEYKFPTITISEDSIKFDKKIQGSLGETLDLNSIDKKYAPKSTISLKPCGIYDVSYNKDPGSDTSFLENNVDKQKFKIERFSMDSDGNIDPDPGGSITTIIYRNLNYSNGGLYLDYYVPPVSTTKVDTPTYIDGQEEGLILRRVYKSNEDAPKKWFLLKPIQLSPNTIPSGKDRWCNYCIDKSNDGGNTFNGKDGTFVPMVSKKILQGLEIIDPAYDNIAKQPDNKVFNVVGKVIEGVAAFATEFVTPIPGEGYAVLAATIYSMIKHPKQFSWENADPAFGSCAQLCTQKVFSVPQNKAVALNSGSLSTPPGHERGLTQDFSQGDVLFGGKVGGLTCKWLYLYKVNSTNNPSIESMEQGSIFKNGNVEFVIQSTYNNTYLFSNSYFNHNTTLVVNSIVSSGHGYGIEAMNNNVITSFSDSSQIFIRSFTSGAFSNDADLQTCNLQNLEKCIINDKIAHHELCEGEYSILDNIIIKLSKLSWFINVENHKIPLRIIFSKLFCNNQTLGSKPFYTVGSAVFDFVEKIFYNKSAFGAVTLTNEQLNSFFPSNTETSNTNFQAFTETEGGVNETLYDESGLPLKLDVTYGDFTREYRLYDNTKHVAFINFISSPTGDAKGGIGNNPDNIEVTSFLDEQYILDNPSVKYEVQEWWVITVNYIGIPIVFEYHNSKASGAKITIIESSNVWSVQESAPRNLLDQTNSILEFPAEDNINLSNNSVLKHGKSPQQIAYIGSFEDINRACYPLKEDPCKNSDLCFWNGTAETGYCSEKDLLQLGKEKYTDLFGNTKNLSGDVFNSKEKGSHFTNITFLKTLQIKELNYKPYVPFTKQNIIGGDPTSFYKSPDFINLKSQGIDNFGTPNAQGAFPSVKLGKFIPYRNFYPSYLDSNGNEESQIKYPPVPRIDESVSDVDIVKEAAIGSEEQLVNNFYSNSNYAQFIPYGKKSLYQSGFTSDDDVPTF